MPEVFVIEDWNMWVTLAGRVCESGCLYEWAPVAVRDWFDKLGTLCVTKG